MIPIIWGNTGDLFKDLILEELFMKKSQTRFLRAAVVLLILLMGTPYLVTVDYHGPCQTRPAFLWLIYTLFVRALPAGLDMFSFSSFSAALKSLSLGFYFFSYYPALILAVVLILSRKNAVKKLFAAILLLLILQIVYLPFNIYFFWFGAHYQQDPTPWGIANVVYYIVYFSLFALGAVYAVFALIKGKRGGNASETDKK